MLPSDPCPWNSAFATSLANRIALVTGTSRGIGAATALALARAGAHVVAVARTVGGLEELDDAIRAVGGTATLVPLDVTDTEGILRLAAALDARYQRLDILIGNAGLVGPSSPLDHVVPKDWDALMAVNVTANWHLIRAMDPLLRKSDAGRAVFISSGAAQQHAGLSRPLFRLQGRARGAGPNLRGRDSFNFGPGQSRQSRSDPHADARRSDAGRRPMTLPPPEQVAEKIVALCLPSFTETGRLYDFPQDKLVTFRRPEMICPVAWVER